MWRKCIWLVAALMLCSMFAITLLNATTDADGDNEIATDSDNISVFIKSDETGSPMIIYDTDTFVEIENKINVYYKGELCDSDEFEILGSSDLENLSITVTLEDGTSENCNLLDLRIVHNEVEEVYFDLSNDRDSLTKGWYIEDGTFTLLSSMSMNQLAQELSNAGVVIGELTDGSKMSLTMDGDESNGISFSLGGSSYTGKDGSIDNTDLIINVYDPLVPDTDEGQKPCLSDKQNVSLVQDEIVLT